MMTRIQNFLEKNNQQFMSRYLVNLNTIRTARVPDRCATDDKNTCDHGCVFAAEKVDFECTCPDDMKYDEDFKECVNDDDSIFTDQSEPSSEPEPSGEPSSEPEPTGEPSSEPEPTGKQSNDHDHQHHHHHDHQGHSPYWETTTGAPKAEPEPSSEPEPTGEPSSEPEPTGEPSSDHDHHHHDHNGHAHSWETGSTPKSEPEPSSKPEPTGEPSSEPEPTGKPSSDHDQHQHNGHAHSWETGSTPKVEPEPSSAPKAEPEPSSEPKSEPEPSSEPKSEPEPSKDHDHNVHIHGLEITTTPKSEPEPSSEPKSEPEPSSEPKSEPEPSSEPKSEPEPSKDRDHSVHVIGLEKTTTPQSEPEPSSEPKSEPEPSSEPKSEPEPSSEPKSTPEPSSEPEPTNDEKTSETGYKGDKKSKILEEETSSSSAKPVSEDFDDTPPPTESYFTISRSKDLKNINPLNVFDMNSTTQASSNNTIYSTATPIQLWPADNSTDHLIESHDMSPFLPAAENTKDKAYSVTENISEIEAPHNQSPFLPELENNETLHHILNSHGMIISDESEEANNKTFSITVSYSNETHTDSPIIKVVPLNNSTPKTSESTTAVNEVQLNSEVASGEKSTTAIPSISQESTESQVTTESSSKTTTTEKLENDEEKRQEESQNLFGEDIEDKIHEHVAVVADNSTIARAVNSTLSRAINSTLTSADNLASTLTTAANTTLTNADNFASTLGTAANTTLTKAVNSTLTSADNLASTLASAANSTLSKAENVTDTITDMLLKSFQPLFSSSTPVPSTTTEGLQSTSSLEALSSSESSLSSFIKSVPDFIFTTTEQTSESTKKVDQLSIGSGSIYEQLAKESTTIFPESDTVSKVFETSTSVNIKEHSAEDLDSRITLDSFKKFEEKIEENNDNSLRVIPLGQKEVPTTTTEANLITNENEITEKSETTGHFLEQTTFPSIKSESDEASLNFRNGKVLPDNFSADKNQQSLDSETTEKNTLFKPEFLEKLNITLDEPMCAEDKFKCVLSHECVSKAKICDGKAQCADHSDEWSCFDINSDTKILQAKKEEKLLKICATKWTSELSDKVCNKLGYAGASTWKNNKEAVNKDEKYLMAKDGLEQFEYVDSCGDGLVEIHCVEHRKFCDS
jgi:Low-density lipoprotein receptor domain class A